MLWHGRVIDHLNDLARSESAAAITRCGASRPRYRRRALMLIKVAAIGGALEILLVGHAAAELARLRMARPVRARSGPHDLAYSHSPRRRRYRGRSARDSER